MKITVVYEDGCRYETDAWIENDDIVFKFPVSGDAVGIILPNGEILKFRSPISDMAYSENPNIPGAPTFYHLQRAGGLEKGGIR